MVRYFIIRSDNDYIYLLVFGDDKINDCCNLKLNKNVFDFWKINKEEIKE